MKTNKLIKHVFAVSVDQSIGNIADCDILIEGQKIKDIRPSIDAPDAEVIDARGMIAMPGLVDAHHHLWQGALRSVTTDWSLKDYVNGIRMFAASFFRPQDMYAASLHGALEKLDAGVTLVADYCHNIHTPDHATEALRGLQDSGARVIWGFGFNAPPLEQPVFKTTAERAAYLRGLAKEKFSGNDRLVTLGVCPEELLFWGDPGSGALQFEVAREVGARIFLHANVTRDAKDVKHLVSRNLLGPDTVLVHMGVTDDDEWQMVADTGASIAVTPETEYQMSMGWPRIDKATALGIPFGIGIDITSNNSADVRYPLRTQLQLERHRINEVHVGEMLDGVPVSSAQALYWGTLGGAKALGLDHKVGSLTPGKHADIVLHDGNHITLAGWNKANPEASLIAQAGSASVSAVLVDGSFVKRNGALCGSVGGDRACRLLTQCSDHVYEQVAKHGGFAQALAGDFMQRLAV